MKKLKAFLLICTMALCASTFSSCSTRVGTKIGILQLVTHPALNQVREGFIDKLKEEGFEDGKNISFNVQNPEGSSTTNYQMASNLAESEELILGIATNSSLALKNSVSTIGKKTPILFSAVTDPVASGLVSNIEVPGKNITGTSDKGDISKTLELMSYFPEISKIGFLYNSSEPNSVIQIDNLDEANPKNNGAKQVCDTLGISYVDGAITSENMISTSIASMVAKGAKALFIPTDNMIAAAINAVKTSAIENSLLVICSDEEVTELGAMLSYGVNYYELGVSTGKMAASILKGEKEIGNIPVGFQEDLPLTINLKIAIEAGITIPQDLIDIADRVIE